MTTERARRRLGALMAAAVSVLVAACGAPPRTTEDLLGTWQRAEDGAVLRLSEGTARFDNGAAYMPILEKGPFLFDGGSSRLDLTLGITRLVCRVEFVDSYLIQLINVPGLPACPAHLTGNWHFIASEIKMSWDELVARVVTTAEIAAWVGGAIVILFTARRLFGWP